MELWIRSQDREDLLEVHNLGLAYKGKYGFMDKIGDIDGYCICEFINDYHVKLGTYSTRERALEVLDEIESLIVGNTRYLITGEQVYTGIKSKDLQSVLYEMPKE